MIKKSSKQKNQKLLDAVGHEESLATLTALEAKYAYSEADLKPLEVVLPIIRNTPREEELGSAEVESSRLRAIKGIFIALNALGAVCRDPASRKQAISLIHPYWDYVARWLRLTVEKNTPSKRKENAFLSAHLLVSLAHLHDELTANLLTSNDIVHLALDLWCRKSCPMQGYESLTLDGTEICPIVVLLHDATLDKSSRQTIASHLEDTGRLYGFSRGLRRHMRVLNSEVDNLTAVAATTRIERLIDITNRVGDESKELWPVLVRGAFLSTAVDILRCILTSTSGNLLVSRVARAILMSALDCVDIPQCAIPAFIQLVLPIMAVELSLKANRDEIASLVAQLPQSDQEFWDIFKKGYDRISCLTSEGANTVGLCDNLNHLPTQLVASRMPQTCSGCRSVAYCSAECQKEDWLRFHRQECREASFTRRDRKALGMSSPVCYKGTMASLIVSLYNECEQPVTRLLRRTTARILWTLDIRSESYLVRKAGGMPGAEDELEIKPDQLGIDQPQGWSDRQSADSTPDVDSAAPDWPSSPAPPHLSRRIGAFLEESNNHIHLVEGLFKHGNEDFHYLMRFLDRGKLYDIANDGSDDIERALYDIARITLTLERVRWLWIARPCWTIA
ncbi:hypothetical protein DFP72DRAFT_858416 [Ephemerocybe angulata]|uniref:MYND-type domain-containing protein n=1 Tax=Ephemerocybe angulata TaxID=980116 RepID=A0A8H6HB25_9AGAR|nr:hypothetical protein DFP72DRAFT_858416 [Tulosesus angulatus]